MVSIGEYTGIKPPIKGCTGKTRYKSKRAADVALASLLRKEGRPCGSELRDADRLNTYECPHCPDDQGRLGWHVGRRGKPAEPARPT